MEARRDPRPFFAIVLLLLLVNSPEPQQQTFASSSRYDQVIDNEWASLKILNRTHRGDLDPGQDRWLNLTGLRKDDSYAWEILAPVQKRFKDKVLDALGPLTEGILDGAVEEAAGPAVYRNISGFVQGEWVRSSHLGSSRETRALNLSAIVPDNPYTFADFDRNLTGDSGNVRIHFAEDAHLSQTAANGSVADISARFVLYDHSSVGDWWEFSLNGVHFPRLGSVLLTTTSEKFAGIFALPHFAVSDYMYSLSQELLNRTIYDTIERQVSRSYPLWNPWTSAIDGSGEGMLTMPHCEYVVYLQAHPVTFHSSNKQYPFSTPSYLQSIEGEMRFPTGSPLPHRTPLSMSMVAFSPDCGFVIESKSSSEYGPSENLHLTGSKTEEYLGNAKLSTLGFAATLSMQLWLLVRQMKEASTPSTRNRVSFYSVAMMALGDGFAFLTLVFMHLLLRSSILVLYSTAFLALFSVVFELRFLMDIWTIQATEQRRQERQRASAAQPTEPSGNARSAQSTEREDGAENGGDSPDTPLPLPVTSTRSVGDTGATPVILPIDQDVDAETETVTNADNGATDTQPSRAELGALYTRYCFVLIATFFLTLHSTSWPRLPRSIYCNVLSFLYLSFWCPQIYRNVIRNCRKALGWDFVLGQSAVRLAPITYIYAVSDNVLFSEPDVTALLILVGWVWVQILALFSQEMLGSRFFVRESWAPPAYDYHPVLREDEEGATLPIGSSRIVEDESVSSSTKAGESKDKGRKMFDCTICTQDIEVPVLPAGVEGESGSGLGANILARRAYMVTPCRHIFHTPCLEGWMRYRLQCPNCREILPPL